MEHKHKIMATVGCESEGTCMVSKNMIDRLSNLPDGVAYHILSFLTIEDLAQVGCVSKRCKELYISTPSLNFKFYNQDPSTCNKRLWMLNSLDRFLVHRGDNKIQYFCVSWCSHSVNQSQELPCFCDDENFRITLTWIQNAVRCNVEELVLKISSPAEALFWEGCRPAQLHKIWFLRTNMWKLTDDLVPAMVSLLKGIPNLRTLYMQFTSVDSASFSSDSDFSRHLGLMWTTGRSKTWLLFTNLRWFPWSFLRGIELAKYILGNAPILQEMTIYYSAKQRSVVRKLKRMKWVLNAIVVFEKV